MFLCPSDARQLPESTQISLANYGGNFGGPFCLAGYTGTLIPSMNPGFTSFFDPDLLMSTGWHDRDRGRHGRDQQHEPVERDDDAVGDPHDRGDGYG